MIPRIVLKSWILVLTGLMVAVALFFTLGSKKHTYQCPYFDKDIYDSCTHTVEKGFPVTYWQGGEGMEYGQYNTSGLIIDTGFWLIISGVLVFGIAMVLPKKKKK
jgi:hypothetical protein